MTRGKPQSERQQEALEISCNSPGFCCSGWSSNQQTFAVSCNLLPFTDSSSLGPVDYYFEYNMKVDFPRVSCAAANTTACLRTTVVLMQGGSHVGPALVMKYMASALAGTQGSIFCGIKRAVAKELKMKAPSVQVR